MVRPTTTFEWYPGHCYVETMLFYQNTDTKTIESCRKVLKQDLPEDQNTPHFRLPQLDLKDLMPPVPDRSLQLIRILGKQPRGLNHEESFADRQDRLHDCHILDRVFEVNGFPIKSVENAVWSKVSTVITRLLEGSERDTQRKSITFQCKARHFCVYWRHHAETMSTRVVLVFFVPPTLSLVWGFSDALPQRMQVLRQCFGHSMLPLLMFGDHMRRSTMAKYERDAEELQAIEFQATLDSANRISTMQTLRDLGRITIRSKLTLFDVVLRLKRCREINASHYLHHVDSTHEDRVVGEHVLLHLDSLQHCIDADLSYLESIMQSVDHQLQTFSMITNMTDGTSLKTLAVLNLIFLPATFVASMFDMPVFPIASSDLFWTFWAVSIPLTILVLATWFGWWYWRVAQRYYGDSSQNVIETLRVWQRGSSRERPSTEVDPPYHMRRRLAGDTHKPWHEGFIRERRLQEAKRVAIV